jgi:hypothetical protein
MVLFSNSIYTTQTKTVAASDPDSHIISIDQSKRQRDARLNKVMQDFDDDDDNDGGKKINQKNQKSRRQADDDDEDDICAMMDRFNK